MTTTAQRLAAIEIGNGRRMLHSSQRKNLQSMDSVESRLTAAAMFRNPGDYEHMKGRYLLESISRFGPVRIGRLIRKTGMMAGTLERKLNDIPQRQRDLIADHLENPHLPGVVPEFTKTELALMQEVCDSLAKRVRDDNDRARLRSIARKCEVAA